MTLIINYPSWATTNELKYCFITCVKEIIMIVFNQWGNKFHTKQITEEEFENFKTNWHHPRWRITTDEMLSIRENLKDAQEIDLPNWLKPSVVFTDA